jgi:succinate dehydrogenase / fumarate reductase flavoprotein subunit
MPPEDRDYFLERRYPAFGNLVPRDVASRAAKAVCDEGRGVGSSGLGVYLDFEDSISRLGRDVVEERYGNLFHMYQKITAENPYEVPMRIFPAVHYTRGGLWVDYNLMSNIDGLFVLGEANFSDHGANRLGASALMQGLADGYFVLPYTMGDYLARSGKSNVDVGHSEFKGAMEESRGRVDKLVSTKGQRSPDSFHKQLGKLLWNGCGMGRNEASLQRCLEEIPRIRDEFAQNIKVTGTAHSLNQTLEKAVRVADFLEFSEVMVHDALHRRESCGGHFREESQSEEGEAQRDDEKFSYVAAWEWKGDKAKPELHKEPLTFEYVKPSTRSYK